MADLTSDVLWPTQRGVTSNQGPLVEDADGTAHVRTCPMVAEMEERSSLGRGPCTCVPGQTVPRTIPKAPPRFDPRRIAPAPPPEGTLPKPRRSGRL